MPRRMLPPGYSARPPTLDDVEQTAAVMAACGEDIDGDELRDDWQQIDLAEEAVVVVGPDGRIVAGGDVLNRGYLRISMYGYVPPEAQGRGIGSYLVGWAERWVDDRIVRAPEGVQIVLEFYANRANEAATRLLEGSGYPLVHTVYVMEADFTAAPPPPDPPPGIVIRTLRVGQDEQAFFEAAEESSRDMWSRPPGTKESWLSPMKADSFDPDLWFLAEDQRTGEIAGVCRALVAGNKGWISSLGVRRPWRGQGLGLALLRRAFGDLYRRDLVAVGLSVDADSPTGAPRVYRRAGMRTTRSYGIYRREIRPGADFTRWLSD